MITAKKQLLSKTTVCPALPQNSEDTKQFCSDGLVYETRDLYRYELKNVFINGNGAIYNTFILLPESIVTERVVKDHSPRYTAKAFLKDFLKRRIHVLPSGNYLSLFDQWTSNHYHLHIDFLPRLLFISKDELANTVLLFRDTNYCRTMVESVLKAFDFSVRGIVYIKVGESVFLKQCTFITKAVISGSSHPALLNQLKTRIAPQQKEECKRIFCVRANTYYRAILNTNEVESALTEFGFVFVDFDVYSIEDQIKMLANAEILVGMHGAGLTNALHMQQGSNLIELRRDTVADHNHCFWHLASAVGVRYWVVFGEPEPGGENEDSHACNLNINIGHLRSVINAIINS